METPDFQDVMTCQPTQDLFFPLFLWSESAMQRKLLATPRAGSESHTCTVNKQSADQDRMEKILQGSRAPAGTHCESGPDTTPNCPEMLSSLVPLIPAGFTPEQGLSEGLNEVQRLTAATPETSNPECPSNGWGYANSISVLLALSGSIATQAGI